MARDYAIYVHIPFCKSRCYYCAFSSCVDFSRQSAYFDKLCNEVAQADVSDVKQISTMFWGGGTPSSVETPFLQKLYNALSVKFPLKNLQEFTVECNPESVTDEKLQFFKEIGVNRISFGLQSVNDDTLKKIGRLHTYGQFLSALDRTQRAGFSNISADLILGLPESRESFLHTVQTVAQLPLQHVSLYALEIHDENSDFAKLCQSYGHTEDDLADMYDAGRAILREKGFERYEVSNFAKKSFRCKHNLVYWRENRYFGFGASAAGFVKNTRYVNNFSVADYTHNIDTVSCAENISVEEEMREFAMLGLRLQEGISLDEFSARYGKNFFEVFPVGYKLIGKGFLQSEKGRVFVPDDKFYVLNGILVELFG